ncbi:helix-turn-helix domain-containing protein [Bdellovibrio sp. HCB274]|uniref:helix-turn-helix domain-containing protein n=1 Tax=Bdellovibrio sp. HCB274 TaxID=3394361 RepID=UPI0039B64AA1
MPIKNKEQKIKDDYPDRLKSIRSKLGMTQRRLAAELYVTPGAINHWENGDRRIPGPVRKLIEIYELIIEQQRKANG